MSVEIDLGGGSYEEAADRTPVGVISAFGGTTAPSGWLMCDGSAVSRTTYIDLYNVIGTAFGEGDGSTTFNLPDLRGRFIRGRDAGQGCDPDAGYREAMATGGNTGDSVGSVQDDAFQGHKHTHYHGVYSDNASGGVAGANGGEGDNSIRCNTNNTINGHSIDSDGSHGSPNVSDESRPKNANVNFIMKY